MFALVTPVSRDQTLLSMQKTMSPSSTGAVTTVTIQTPVPPLPTPPNNNLPQINPPPGNIITNAFNNVVTSVTKMVTPPSVDTTDTVLADYTSKLLDEVFNTSNLVKTDATAVKWLADIVNKLKLLNNNIGDSTMMAKLQRTLSDILRTPAIYKPVALSICEQRLNLINVIHSDLCVSILQTTANYTIILHDTTTAITTAKNNEIKRRDNIILWIKDLVYSPEKDGLTYISDHADQFVIFSDILNLSADDYNAYQNNTANTAELNQLKEMVTKTSHAEPQVVILMLEMKRICSFKLYDQDNTKDVGDRTKLAVIQQINDYIYSGITQQSIHKKVYGYLTQLVTHALNVVSTRNNSVYTKIDMIPIGLQLDIKSSLPLVQWVKVKDDVGTDFDNISLCILLVDYKNAIQNQISKNHLNLKTIHANITVPGIKVYKHAAQNANNDRKRDGIRANLTKILEEYNQSITNTTTEENIVDALDFIQNVNKNICEMIITDTTNQQGAIKESADLIKSTKEKMINDRKSLSSVSKHTPGSTAPSVTGSITTNNSATTADGNTAAIVLTNNDATPTVTTNGDTTPPMSSDGNNPTVNGDVTPTVTTIGNVTTIVSSDNNTATVNGNTTTADNKITPADGGTATPVSSNGNTTTADGDVTPAMLSDDDFINLYKDILHMSLKKGPVAKFTEGNKTFTDKITKFETRFKDLDTESLLIQLINTLIENGPTKNDTKSDLDIKQKRLKFIQAVNVKLSGLNSTNNKYNQYAEKLVTRALGIFNTKDSIALKQMSIIPEETKQMLETNFPDILSKINVVDNAATQAEPDDFPELKAIPTSASVGNNEIVDSDKKATFTDEYRKAILELQSHIDLNTDIDADQFSAVLSATLSPFNTSVATIEQLNSHDQYLIASRFNRVAFGLYSTIIQFRVIKHAKRAKDTETCAREFRQYWMQFLIVCKAQSIIPSIEAILDDAEKNITGTNFNSAKKTLDTQQTNIVTIYTKHWFPNINHTN